MVLADEPTGALDSKSARQLLETFEHLNQNLGATILMVTHDAFTASYADKNHTNQKKDISKRNQYVCIKTIK